MADDKITTTIKCQNIAPIENLTREIKSSSLKMGVFANNGSGKTFLSRLFRLTEKQDELVLDENNKSPATNIMYKTLIFKWLIQTQCSLVNFLPGDKFVSTISPTFHTRAHWQQV